MDSIVNYFIGERVQCVIGLVISLIFVSASAYFLFQDKSFLKGMAYVALPLSILLTIICTGVIFRTNSDIKRVTDFYETSPAKIRTEELPRMDRVMKNFAIVKKVELGLFILGLVLAVFFRNNDLIQGIAKALMLMGFTLYLFDHFAELRGKTYIEFLNTVVFK